MRILICLMFIMSAWQNVQAQERTKNMPQKPQTQEEADRLEKLKYHTRDDEKLSGKPQKMEDDPNHPGDKRKNMK